MARFTVEESYLSFLRRSIEEQYEANPTGCGGSFGELLCWEIHENGQTFIWLAEKWGVSLPTLGELIWDHCKRLEPLPAVNHEIGTNEQNREQVVNQTVLDRIKVFLRQLYGSPPSTPPDLLH